MPLSTAGPQEENKMIESPDTNGTLILAPPQALGPSGAGAGEDGEGGGSTASSQHHRSTMLKCSIAEDQASRHFSTGWGGLRAPPAK